MLLNRISEAMVGAPCLCQNEGRLLEVVRSTQQPEAAGRCREVEAVALNQRTSTKG